MLKGGCACGRVRFRLDEEPYDTGWCHCRLCQRISGSGGMVFTTVHASRFILERGSERIGRFRSTSFGERSFCSDCGSPLWMHVRHQPDELDIPAGSLDEPDAVTPRFHLYAGCAPHWMPLDEFPRYEALRPDTRGLKPGQTEP